MSIKVLICLTPLCWEELKHLDSKESIILTDLTIDSHNGVLMRPVKDNSATSQLCDDVKSVFQKQANNLLQENLVGFANIFYECSIRPIASFIDAIDNVCKAKSINEFTFYFSSIYVSKKRFSTYFMAEYESQGYRLYCREGVVGPYLVDYINSLGASAQALSYKKINPQIFYSKLRIHAVLFRKLAWSVAKFIRDIIFYEPYSHRSFNVNRFIIVRSKMQLNALKNYISSTNNNLVIAVGESYLDRGACFGYARALYESNPRIQLCKLTDFSLKKIFSDYLFSFLRIQSSIKRAIIYKGIPIDLTFAFNEIQALVPEVNSYHRSLDSALNMLNTSREVRVLSTEQKTPHAFVDASLGAKYGFKVFHLMIVDQHIHKLPIPVFGDYFVCDSLMSRFKMAEVHSGYENSFIYIGTIRAIGSLPQNCMKSVDLKRGKIIGFFTQADSGASHHYQFNFKVMDILLKICKKNSLDFFLKLHPRDRIFHYRKKIPLKSTSINIFDFAISSADAIDCVDIVVSFPSAIVLEALYKNVPTIILGFGVGTDPSIQLYWDDRYVGCVKNLSELDERLLDDLDSQFLIYRKNLFQKLGLKFDCKSFDESIDNI